MSVLIADNGTLMQFVPNVLKNVQGELSLYEKIASHLEVAEQWLTATFLSERVLTVITSGADDSNRLLHYARMVVTAEAMLHAVPQLDLVLTPNGFGIVNNANVVPASKERLQRLLATLEKIRDDALQVLLPLLAAQGDWRKSKPCSFFEQTLYPWLDLPRKLGFGEHTWLKFQELHEKQFAIEERLAHDFFSCELLNVLRKANLHNAWENTASAPHYRSAWQHIFAIVLFMLREEEANPPFASCIEVVNSLRNAPDAVFHEWKNSEVAKLFENHGYKNLKKSGGFWF